MAELTERRRYTELADSRDGSGCGRATGATPRWQEAGTAQANGQRRGAALSRSSIAAPRFVP
jgi:hypothetical protein